MVILAYLANSLAVPAPVSTLLQTPDSFRIRYRTWFIRWILVEGSVWSELVTVRSLTLLSTNKRENHVRKRIRKLSEVFIFGYRIYVR